MKKQTRTAHLIYYRSIIFDRKNRKSVIFRSAINVARILTFGMKCPINWLPKHAQLESIRQQANFVHILYLILRATVSAMAKIPVLLLLAALPLISCKFVDFGAPKHQPSEKSSRIIGGSVVQPGKAPYQCSVRAYGNHVCSCAILSDQWVLTGVNCLGYVWAFCRRLQSSVDSVVESHSNISGSLYTFFVACNRTTNVTDIFVGSVTLDKAGRFYAPAEFVYHPRYLTGGLTLAYLVVLVRLAEKLQFDENVQPIELSTNLDEDGSDAVLSMQLISAHISRHFYYFPRVSAFSPICLVRSRCSHFAPFFSNTPPTFISRLGSSAGSYLKWALVRFRLPFRRDMFKCNLIFRRDLHHRLCCVPSTWPLYPPKIAKTISAFSLLMRIFAPLPESVKVVVV